MALTFRDENGVAVASPWLAVLGPALGDSYTVTVEFADRKNLCVSKQSGCSLFRIPPVGAIKSVSVEGDGSDKWEAFIFDEAAPGFLIPLTNKPTLPLVGKEVMK